MDYFGYLDRPYLKRTLLNSMNVYQDFVESVCSSDNYDNTLTSEEVLSRCHDYLDHWLRYRNHDLNFSNRRGETVLHIALKLTGVESFIDRLVKEGCNINKPTWTLVTPLHLTTLHPTTDIAEKFIQQGARINARDMRGCTPLHFAILGKNFIAICLLLYYQANVSSLCWCNIKPDIELQNSKLNIALLINKYSSLTLSYALGRAVQYTVDEMNLAHFCGEHALEFCMYHENAEYFKLIWLLFDYKNLAKSRRPFLLTYLQKQAFSTTEWVECFYLILQSPVAARLMKKYMHYVDTSYAKFIKTQDFLIRDLIHAFYLKSVQLPDRIKILYTCFSLGAPVNIIDVNFVIEIFGFGAELEACIYCYNLSNKVDKKDCRNFPLSTFILALDEGDTTELAFQLLKNQIRLSYDIAETLTAQNAVIKSLGYFAFSSNMKHELLDVWERRFNDRKRFLMELQKIPDVPSLMELTRNKMRQVIKDNYVINRPYQFYDIVKSIGFPEPVHNIILFRTRLYDNKDIYI